MHTVALYYKPTCGYCLKVLAFMKQNGLTIPLKNVNEQPAVREELIAIAGKTQVPCLVINGKPLHESDDIVQWLKQNWSSNGYKGS